MIVESTKGLIALEKLNKLSGYESKYPVSVYDYIYSEIPSLSKAHQVIYSNLLNVDEIILKNISYIKFKSLEQHYTIKTIYTVDLFKVEPLKKTYPSVEYIVNLNGDILAESNISEIYFNNNHFIIGKEEPTVGIQSKVNYYLYNLHLDLVFANSELSLLEFINDSFIVTIKDNLCGLIDYKGTIICDAIYSIIEPCTTGELYLEDTLGQPFLISNCGEILPYSED